MLSELGNSIFVQRPRRRLIMLYFIFYTVLAFRRKSSARPSGEKVTCRTVAGPEEDVRRVAPAAETQPR